MPNNSRMKIRGLFLDYDGTISPLNVGRAESGVSDETRAVLTRAGEHIPVAVITTKDLGFILSRTSFATAWGAVGGLEIKIGEKIIADPCIDTSLPYLTLALEYARRSGDGLLFIEEKKNSKGQTIAFCVDWRQAQDPKEAGSRASHILASCQRPPLNVIGYAGQPFFDVYPCPIDKGKALTEMKRELKLRNGIIYLGDSKLDNPAFKAADIGIGILDEDTAADLSCDYYIRFEDVAGFLRRLIDNDLIFSTNFPEIEPRKR